MIPILTSLFSFIIPVILLVFCLIFLMYSIGEFEIKFNSIPKIFFFLIFKFCMITLLLNSLYDDGTNLHQWSLIIYGCLLSFEYSIIILFLYKLMQFFKKYNKECKESSIKKDYNQLLRELNEYLALHLNKLSMKRTLLIISFLIIICGIVYAFVIGVVDYQDIQNSYNIVIAGCNFYMYYLIMKLLYNNDKRIQ